MNTLDIVLLLLFIPGIIRGLSKGFLEQAVSLIGVLAAAYLAFKASDRVGAFIGPIMGLEGAALSVVAFLLIFILEAIVLIIFSKLATKLIEMATLGWLNRTLGVLLSILVTALVLGLVLNVFESLDTQYLIVENRELIDGSTVYSLLKDFTSVAFPFLRELFETATTSSHPAAVV